MNERDPYDYSALAPDLDFGDDSQSVLGDDHAMISQQFVLSEEMGEDLEFEMELEAMLGGEGLPQPGSLDDDVQARQLQEAIQRLSEGLVDLQLEADEAWLESLLLEDALAEDADFD